MHSGIIHNPSTVQTARLVMELGSISPLVCWDPANNPEDMHKSAHSDTSAQACSLVPTSKPTEHKNNTMCSKSGQRLSNTQFSKTRQQHPSVLANQEGKWQPCCCSWWRGAQHPTSKQHCAVSTPRQVSYNTEMLTQSPLAPEVAPSWENFLARWCNSRSTLNDRSSKLQNKACCWYWQTIIILYWWTEENKTEGKALQTQN